jgi:hypothetical protein
MTRRILKLYLFGRITLGVMSIVLVACFYLITAQIITWHTISTGTPVNQPAQQLPCVAHDASYCSLMRRLVSAVEAGDFSQLLANQLVSTVVCPDAAAGSYCANAAAGTPLSLFTVYIAGQPKLMMRNDYIAFFRSYEAHAGRFVYKAPTSGVQNPLLFRDQHGSDSLELQLQQTPGAGWEFVWPIAPNSSLQ